MDPYGQVMYKLGKEYVTKDLCPRWAMNSNISTEKDNPIKMDKRLGQSLYKVTSINGH